VTIRLRPHITLLTLIATLLLAINSTGCVHRRLTIRSQPVGAKVYVDGQDAGFTPTSVDFTYYATREVRLVKPGFETQTRQVRLAPPWYQTPPLDFFSDNFSPGRVTDRREVRFTMEPSVIVPKHELLDRANSLRTESRIGK
jgi:hypothetical protein